MDENNTNIKDAKLALEYYLERNEKVICPFCGHEMDLDVVDESSAFMLYHYGNVFFIITYTCPKCETHMEIHLPSKYKQIN